MIAGRGMHQARRSRLTRISEREARLLERLKSRLGKRHSNLSLVDLSEGFGRMLERDFQRFERDLEDLLFTEAEGERLRRGLFGSQGARSRR